MKTKKVRAGQPGHSLETVMLVGFDPDRGGMSQIEVSAEVGARYLDLHRVVPGDIERWTPEHLRWIVGGLKLGASQAEWETALILLAHHRSLLARDLLASLDPRVPGGVREFYEVALGEAQGWLEDAADPASLGDLGDRIRSAGEAN